MSTETPLVAAAATITNPAPVGIWQQLSRFRLTQATTELGIILQSIGLMIAAFAVSRRSKWTKLPEEAYFSPKYSGGDVPELAEWFASGGQRVCLAGLVTIEVVRPGHRQRPPLLHRRDRRYPGLDFQHVRVQLVLRSGLLPGRRMLLVVLWAGAMWRPVLIVPFTRRSMAWFTNSINPLPAPGPTKAHCLMCCRCSWHFWVRLWKSPSWRAIPVNEFFYLAYRPAGGQLFRAGNGEVSPGPALRRTPRQLVCSQLSQRLVRLSYPPKQALSWARLIADWNPFLVWSSLILELAALFCLWNRRGGMLLLASCMGLHAMICLTTADFFWKWVILDAALVGVLAFRNREVTEMLFAPGRRWLSVGLILAVRCTSTRTGWHGMTRNSMSAITWR